MRMKLLAAVAAALVVGAAQAITWSWTGEYGSEGGRHFFEQADHLQFGQSATYAAVVNFADPSQGSGAILTFNSGNGSRNRMTVEVANGQLTAYAWDWGQGMNEQFGATYVEGADRTLTAGKHVIGVVADWTADGVGTITVSLDGVDVATLSGELYPYGWTDFMAAIAYATDKQYGYGPTGGQAEYDLYFVKEAHTAQEIYDALNPVPEPTALALLALGVAGLALRRRAR